MNKNTIENIIKEYESNTKNKGFVSIIMHDGKKYGQTPLYRDPLTKFELFDNEILLVEFNEQTWYIKIDAIDMILFRPKFLI